MSLVVQKFGGTSVADAERIRAVADHVARTRRHGHRVVVVVSAMGKETDELLHLAAQVAGVRPGRELDMLITGGERKAMALLAMALIDAGCPAASFTGSQAEIITDTSHTRARIKEVRGKRLRAALAAGQVPVVGGAQGMSSDREVTFLGRGGSDTTAVALAHALGADSCEMYTDVPGVFSADPRLVPTARRLRYVSYEELLEMCASGCPKPDMRAVEYARNHGVRLHIRSSFTWEPGTWALDADEVDQRRSESTLKEEKTVEQAIVTAVVHDTTEAKVTVTHVPDRPGVAARLVRLLADADVNMDMIVQNVSLDGTTTDISFTVPKSDLAVSLATCRDHAAEVGAADVLADADIAKVSLIGAGMKTNPGVAATTFEALAEAGINIEMISTSPIRISCVIRADAVERAVESLHNAFDLG
ncbi:MAG: aspartate kinase [Acidimicrobiales bacterium]